MTYPIKLNTSVGEIHFNILHNQRNHYVKLGLQTEFKRRCQLDYTMQTKNMSFFLDSALMSKKYPMNEDDIDGFRIFNEQSDIVSCLNYFREY